MDASGVIATLEQLLPSWLPNQRWFSSAEESPRKVEIVDHDWIITGEPALFWTLVRVDGGPVYQVPVGVRTEAEIGPTLLGHPTALIGPMVDKKIDYLLYDGLIDGALTKPLFNEFAPNETISTVRPIGLEQSNTSLVYDNRIICKMFRRLYEGSNPDLEVTAALTEAGFEHVAQVVAAWQREDWDLAMAQPYLYDGADGWSLALLSVRDFLRIEYVASSSNQGTPNKLDVDIEDPAKAGGNFGNEAHRLGEVTAKMHLALALQFGTKPFDPAQLADSLAADVDSLDGPEHKSLQVLIENLRAIPAGRAGKSGRTHGDFHFGQTLRSTGGWYIFDFEGEPARTFAERRKLTSPLKDLTGMLRSFHYAAATGLSEQMESDQADLVARAESWEQYNCAKFRQGYLSVDGIDSLLPPNDGTRDLIHRGFEIEKALYELAYEKAHRPDWVAIPEGAIRRILAE